MKNTVPLHMALIASYAAINVAALGIQLSAGRFLTLTDLSLKGTVPADHEKLFNTMIDTASQIAGAMPTDDRVAFLESIATTVTDFGVEKTEQPIAVGFQRLLDHQLKLIDAIDDSARQRMPVTVATINELDAHLASFGPKKSPADQLGQSSGFHREGANAGEPAPAT